MKTYHIITIGCQMNKSDSERIAGYLEERGFIGVQNPEKADVVVLTTCGVRQSAEDRVYGLAPRIKRANPKGKIILTGCLSEREDVKRRLKRYIDIWMPITELDSLENKLVKFFKKETKFPIGSLASVGDYLRNKPKYNSSFSAFVPIGNGCNNFCSYCVVPYARGREVYGPAQDIIDEVKNLVEKGYKEIILIAQNVNSYTSRILSEFKANHNEYKVGDKIYFPDLLRMVNDIKGDFWIRFATSHPKDMSGELVRTIASCEKVCQHIHLPAQSGDDEVLKMMNRKYTRKHYLELVRKIRKIFNPKSEILNPKQIQNPKSKIQNLWKPPVSITTDIIVGFPGETRQQFYNTAKLFQMTKFDMAYIAQYSPRPGTISSKMKDDVTRIEKKRREEALMKILRKTALENNKKYLGKVVEVLIEGENRRGGWFGKTRTNKQVRIMNYELRIKNLMGTFVKVKINKVKDFGLEGNIFK